MYFESLSNLVSYLQRGISPKYSESGIPIINQKCIRNGQLKKEDVKFHDIKKTYSKEKELQKDDILVNSTGVGTLGRVARCTSENEKLLADSHVTIVRADPEKINPLYLFYVLRLNEPVIVELGAGSTGQTELSRLTLGSLQIPVPSINIQQKIAEMLLSLEEKVLLNQRLASSLEEIAQTIFKSWFVDFDPVKAKMAGEKPAGMDSATAALFPDTMEDSELGVVPKTWEIKMLGEVVDISWGDTKTTKASYVTNGFKAYSAKGQDGFLTKFDYSEMGIVLSAIGANCGKTWLATGKWSCIKNTMRIIGTPSYPDAIPYIYFLTNRLDFWERRGTAQPFIGQEDSRSLRILFPGRYLVDRFSEITTPIFDKINKISEENDVLNELRDSLLPRLISGELQIPEEMLAS